MPHSQCSLKENTKFYQYFRHKNNILKGYFDQYLHLIFAIVIQAYIADINDVEMD
jgi:hypothetical protein